MTALTTVVGVTYIWTVLTPTFYITIIMQHPGAKGASAVLLKATQIMAEVGGLDTVIPAVHGRQQGPIWLRCVLFSCCDTRASWEFHEGTF